MALDTSIYGMIQPQQAVDPLANYGKAISLQNMIGQNDLHQLQTGKLRKDIATDEAISAAVRTSGGDPEKIRAAFVGAGAHKELQAWEKAQLEAKEKNGAILKTKFETEKLKAASLRDDIVSLGPDSDMAAFAERAKALYGPDIVGRVKIPPVFNAEWQVKAAQDGKQFIDNLEKQKDRDVTTRGQDMTANTALAGQNITVRGQNMTDARTRSEGAANRGVTLRGQNLTNERAVEQREAGKWTNDLQGGVQINSATGETRPITTGGVPVTPREHPPEFQAKSAGFAQRMANANPLFVKNAAGEKPGVIESTLATIPVAGRAAANMARDDTRQMYRQAQEDWVRAKLRMESGAVIGKDEMDDEIRTYFPQLNDGDKVIAQKATARKTAEDAMVTNAGSAYKPKAPKTPDRESKGKIGGVNPAQLSDAELRRELGL